MFSYLDLPKGLIGTPTGRLNSPKTNNKNFRSFAFPNSSRNDVVEPAAQFAGAPAFPRRNQMGRTPQLPPRKEGSPDPLDLRYPSHIPLVFRISSYIRLRYFEGWKKHCLVGGWTNPSEKYARQNGNLPQVGVNNKKYLKPPPKLRIWRIFRCLGKESSRDNDGFHKPLRLAISWEVYP